MRIAVSGHRDLYGHTAELVQAELRRVIAELANDGEKLIGITCLADGADQMFAEAILEADGDLEVVVPAAGYRDGLPETAHADYDRLLTAACTTRTLDHIESNSQAHMDASIEMLNGADHLIAVWDGKPARGFGGTADVVVHARENDIPVSVVWPDGAERGRE